MIIICGLIFKKKTVAIYTFSKHKIVDSRVAISAMARPSSRIRRGTQGCCRTLKTTAKDLLGAEPGGPGTRRRSGWSGVTWGWTSGPAATVAAPARWPSTRTGRCRPRTVRDTRATSWRAWKRTASESKRLITADDIAVAEETTPARQRECSRRLSDGRAQTLFQVPSCENRESAKFDHARLTILFLPIHTAIIRDLCVSLYYYCDRMRQTDRYRACTSRSVVRDGHGLTDCLAFGVRGGSRHRHHRRHLCHRADG